MDTTMLGQLAADLMEKIETQFADVENATCRTAMLLVEIDMPGHLAFRSSSTDDRPWVQYAFVDEFHARLERIVEQGREPKPRRDDDGE